MSAIHAAAAKGQTKAVQWLLQHGLSINAHTAVGDTPLMMAVMGGHRETVEHMLENHANVSAVNADGDSALHRCLPLGAGARAALAHEDRQK
jgi:ankyrin repeat protein